MKSEEIIWVSQVENLYQLFQLLRKSPAEKLFFILPSSGKLAHNLLAFKILEQLARSLNKELFFVSGELWVREMLRRANLPYLHRLESRPKEPPPPPSRERAPLSASRRTSFKLSWSHLRLTPVLGNWRYFLSWLLPLFLGLFLLFLIFQLALAQVVIEITLLTSPFEQSFVMSFIDPRESFLAGPNLLRGQFLEALLTQAESFPAGGSKNVGSKARGEVLFTNRSGERFSFKAGTPLLSAGKNFLLEQGIIIPPATVDRSGQIVPGERRAKVIAEAGGSSYNLVAGEFTLPGLSKLVQGRTLGPFSGGTDQLIKIVSPEDLIQAQASLTPKLRAELLKELEQKLPPGKILYPELIRELVVEVLPSKKENEEAEKFDLKLTLRLWTVALDQDELPLFIEELSRASLKSSEKLTPDSWQNISLHTIQENFLQRELKAEVKIRGRATLRLNHLSLQESFRRKSFSWVKDTLSRYPDVVSVEIKRVGLGGKNMPWLSRNIRLEEFYH